MNSPRFRIKTARALSEDISVSQGIMRLAASTPDALWPPVVDRDIAADSLDGASRVLCYRAPLLKESAENLGSFFGFLCVDAREDEYDYRVLRVEMVPPEQKCEEIGLEGGD